MLEVVVDVVAVIGIRIVLEHRREPDGRASEPGDVVQIVRDAFDLAAVERVGSLDSGRAAARTSGARFTSS